MEIAELEAQFIGLMVLAVLVAIVARRSRRLPYATALVLTGLFVGAPQISEGFEIHLDPHLVFLTFLPGLLFEAAYHLDISDLHDHFRTIGLLAVPGLLLSMGTIGVLLHVLLEMPIAEALLFGVLISATDPIAVVSQFKRLGVSKHLRIIVEGESLFNDGTAVVLFTILSGIVIDNQTPSLIEGGTGLIVSVAGGIILGWAVGLIATWFLHQTDDHLIDLSVTLIAAYGTYLFTEVALHSIVSPVITVVVAGVYIGSKSARSDSSQISATTRVTTTSFWEFVTFLINSAIFLLIGLEVKLDNLLNHAGEIGVAIVVILLARALVIYSFRRLMPWPGGKMPWAWTHVLVWGGLRGAVSMALALSLPMELDLLKTLAFGYVLFSLVVQATTLEPLIKKLGMTRKHELQQEYERRYAQLEAAQAVGRNYKNRLKTRYVPRAVYDAMECSIEERVEASWQNLRDLVNANPLLDGENLRGIHRENLLVEKRTLLDLVRRGALSEEVYSELASEINEAIEASYQDDWEVPESLRETWESVRNNQPPPCKEDSA